MCEPMTLAVVAGGAALVGAGVQTVAGIKKGRFEEQVAKNRAKQARWAQADALQRGAGEAGQVRAAGRRANATALTGLAASNVDTASGSPADLLAQNAAVYERDAEQVKANAVRERWGLRNEELDTIAQGIMAKRSSFLTGVGGGLSGIGQSASTFGSLYKTKG